MLNNKKGFTILEVLIAMLIISFGLLGLMRALSGGLMGSKRAHDVTIATLLAQQKMEELRYNDWDSLVSESKDPFSAPNANFEYETTVTPGIPAAYLKEVSLSIWWPAGASGQRCVNLKTCIAKYD